MGAPFLFLALLDRFQWFEQAFRSALPAVGDVRVSRAQALLLASVLAGERRPSRIARRLGVTRQAVSQLLADCERLGLVRLEADPRDARARVVHFTPQARAFERAGLEALCRAEEELGRRVGVEQLAALRAILAIDWGAAPAAAPEPAAAGS
ncbi:MAG: MarR family transcriptional regulator [Sphingomonadaceae bacterium]|uniref:MarR family winged helix-turn-helix transcriptional regulator n=1 Tax=Thermaurantiacus sp. TaxID=2820283 RepID=UPI00298F0608|nr:helix-turn-helix domain-containing protein [Thermaurantiacus sp.]MCS6986281.1 MarR family transcriptional regulator [Sphingomonadaceae bacterium]MDW8415730.1 helix-turn-helix domain-containing protein [Thermaurantiacus sp.]